MDVAAVQRSLVDEDDFANVLNKYYYDRDLLKKHSKNSEQWAKKNVSWGIISKQWEKTVEDTLSGD